MIDIIRFDIGDAEQAAQLVECYRDVFAEHPWHEWMQCPACKQYWGKKDAALLARRNYHCCSVPLVDFWPREQVIADIRNETSGNASSWIALDDGHVVGFCWGYASSTQHLEEKLGLRLSLDNLAAHETDAELTAYQDEVGVLSEYRGRGLARMMVARRLKDFLMQGLRIGVVRTRMLPESSVTFSWYTRALGYRIVAQYPGDDGRVILAQRLERLQHLLA